MPETRLADEAGSAHHQRVLDVGARVAVEGENEGEFRIRAWDRVQVVVKEVISCHLDCCRPEKVLSISDIPSDRDLTGV